MVVVQRLLQVFRAKAHGTKVMAVLGLEGGPTGGAKVRALHHCQHWVGACMLPLVGAGPQTLAVGRERVHCLHQRSLTLVGILHPKQLWSSGL